MDAKPKRKVGYRETMVVISFRATPEEWEILDAYCEQKAITKTQFLRTTLQDLEKKIKKA